MRPLRIAIEGLRSFRSEVAIDFGDRTQIAVIGDTGAGKSSILEAMTYALYGQTSLGGRSKQELMNDTSDVMRVVLRFRVSGEEWEVARVDRRAGAGGLRPAHAQLVRYGPGGEMIEKVEQVRSVNERVQALIGLDSDAFLRTVILPQGRFARLLVQDAPSARTEILRQVWRTQDLEAAGEAAGRSLTDVRHLNQRLQDEAGRHPADPHAHLAELARRADTSEGQAAAGAELLDRAVRARDAIRKADATIRAATNVAETVNPEVLDELADQLAPVDKAQRRIDAERAKTEELEGRLIRDLNGIPADDGPDQRMVAQALAVLKALPKQAEDAAKMADALREAIAGEAEAEKRLTHAQQALESAEGRVDRHQKLKAPLAEAVDTARDLVEETKRRHAKCADLQERIGSTEVAAAERDMEVRAAAARLVTARREQQGARERQQGVERELSEAQRANSAAAAAHGLCPGDECPVCRSELPEGWVAPPDTGLDAARQACEEARRLAADAGKAVAEAEAQRKASERRLQEARSEVKDVRSGLADALGRLRSAAGRDEEPPFAEDGPLPDREQVLGPVQRRQTEAETKLREHCDEADGLRAAHTSAQVDSRTAQQTLQHAQATIRTARNSADSALAGLRQSLKSVSPPFRPDLPLPSDPQELDAVDLAPVARAAYAAGERGEILNLREQKRNGLRNEIEQARQTLRSLEDARRKDVENPLHAIVRTLADHRRALADAVRPLEAGIAVPNPLHHPVDTKALSEGMAELRAAMVESVEQATGLRRRARESADEGRNEAADVADQFDPPADPTDIEALVQSTNRAADEARYAARDATRARDKFAAIVDDIVALHQAARQVAALELALGDLDAALKPGAFLKWLTLRRSRNLLVCASRMLSEMTGGRYAFADPGDLDDQQWLVVDKDSGQARSPASLSGGEQFIGSLALALGMVEMMARSGGRLESLFLDEGFGSLDRNNLDAAIEALSVVSAAGRMVGVISHVAAVAEQIDDVLAVMRGASGSAVQWLSRAQRQEFARSDAGADGASAMAGLLD